MSANRYEWNDDDVVMLEPVVASAGEFTSAGAIKAWETRDRGESGWVSTGDAPVPPVPNMKLKVLAEGWLYSADTGSEMVPETEFYIDNGYHDMNHALRHGRDGTAPAGGWWNDPAEVAHATKQMDAAMAEYDIVTNEEGIVYRGNDVLADATLNVGDVQVDKGFMSVTLNKETTDAFGVGNREGQRTVVIEVPKGVRLLPGAQGDSELILDRGQVMQLIATDPPRYRILPK